MPQKQLATRIDADVKKAVEDICEIRQAFEEGEACRLALGLAV